jgi:hypothetical protein
VVNGFSGPGEGVAGPINALDPHSSLWIGSWRDLGGPGSTDRIEGGREGIEVARNQDVVHQANPLLIQQLMQGVMSL